MASGLLVGLRKEMNGAVVADMESRGLSYKRNYGVSLHTVRAAAREYAPDHGFAKYLWTQSVRELKLAATTIANPAEITLDETEFWLAGADNSELAESLGSFLLSRTAVVRQIIDTYIDSDNTLHAYAAILAAVRGYPADMDADEAISLFEKIKTHTVYTERASALFLSRAANASEDNRRRIAGYVGTLRTSVDPAGTRIAEEIFI